jgi:hypothetical protein
VVQASQRAGQEQQLMRLLHSVMTLQMTKHGCYLTPLNATTMAPEAIQTRVLRSDNTANNSCVRNGIQGIRLRVEGGINTNFCPEFDEIKLGTTFASVTSLTNSVKIIAPLIAHISPNPVKENLTISLTEAASPTKILVHDILGHLVLSSTFYGLETIVNVSNLVQGMYIMTLQNEDKMSVQKFVKE